MFKHGKTIMSDKKRKGVYYTPQLISDFMIKHALTKLKSENISILEPSVGDGVFVQSLNSFLEKKNSSTIDLTIIETENEELLKAKIKINKKYVKNSFSKNIDFLEFAIESKKEYDLVIGNPPFIKNNYLTDLQKSHCKIIHQQSNLSKKEIHNIWTAFVVASQSLLFENGILAFILPADLLQVKYAEEIRVLLEELFDRLEIFSINDKDFGGIEQQVVILFGYKKSKQKGVFFYKFLSNQYKKYKRISSNGLMVTNSKWTHYCLTEEEIKLLNSLDKKLSKVSDFIDSNPGIVTGANDYFILSKDKIDEYGLDDFHKPIIQKSSFINGSLIFTKSNFQKIVKDNKPAYLLSLENIDLEKKSDNKLKNYLENGIYSRLNKRYKCSERKIWYVVPNIKKQPNAFFFKRSHILPKLIKNSANVYVTDAAYNINTKKNYHINSFIYSFYNIITLIFAELLGRKYGGGVLELTPKEFKGLPIPYIEVLYPVFLDFTKEYEKSLNKIDLIIRKSELSLKESLNISHKEFDSLTNIYFKLIRNRIPRNVFK